MTIDSFEQQLSVNHLLGEAIPNTPVGKIMYNHSRLGCLHGRLQLRWRETCPLQYDQNRENAIWAIMKSKLLYRFKLIFNFLFNLQFIKLPILNIDRDIDFSSVIPNIVFQTSNKSYVPFSLYREIQTSRAINPEFSYILFDDFEMNTWMLGNFPDTQILEAFTNARFGVMRSDIFKYCYAYVNGGISLDLTKGLSNKLNSKILLPRHSLVLSQERNEIFGQDEIRSWFIKSGLKPNLLINWCFGVSPKHAAIFNVIKQIERNYLNMKNVTFRDVKSAVWNGTGPIAFNRGVMEYLMLSHSSEVSIHEFDFGEINWPKFKSSIYLNSFRRHYTEFMQEPIWVAK